MRSVFEIDNNRLDSNPVSQEKARIATRLRRCVNRLSRHGMEMMSLVISRELEKEMDREMAMVVGIDNI